jgi:hypothetical protein
MADIIEGGILINGLHPDVYVQGSIQRLIWGNGAAPEPLGALKLYNKVVPTSSNPTITNLDLSNNTFSGFRLAQRTITTDTCGSFAIKRFLNNDPMGESIIDFENDGSVTFQKPVVFNNTASFSGLNIPKLGISIDPTTTGTIEFANTDLTAKLILSRNAPASTYDVSGIGYLSTIGTIYNTPLNKNHTFFNGANGSLSLSITPTALKLSYGLNSTDFRKLSFYETADNPHQTLGIGADLASSPSRKRLRSQVSTTVDEFIWFFGESNSSSIEKMKLSYNALVLQNNLTMGGFDILNGTNPVLQVDSSNGTLTFNNNNSIGTTEYLLSRGGIASLKIGVTGSSVSNNNAYINLIGGQSLNIQSDGVSKMYINKDGAIVLGTGAVSFALAKMDVNGGIQNVYNEDSCIRASSSSLSAKIEVCNTSASGKLYTIGSTSTGTLNIKDETAGLLRMSIASNGDLTLGNIVTGSWQASTINVSRGGTGLTTYTPYSLLCAGTTATGIFQNVGTGTLGQTLTSNGSSALPTWQNFPTTQVITGSSETFQFNDVAAAFILNNLNVTATTTSEYWLSRNGTAGLKIGIIGDSPSNRVSYINSINGAPLQFQNDGATKIYMNGSGSLVIGSLLTPVSKLDIYGGVQNIAGEDSCLRVISSSSSAKIELYNTATGGKLYEIRSGSISGVLDIVSRTDSISRFAIYGGFIGLNMGLTLPSYTCDVNGTTRTKKLLGTTGAPTAVLGTAAGTGAVATITGSELCGTISISTGTGATSGLIGTFTISAMPYATFAVFIKANTTTTAAANLQTSEASTSTTTFTFTAANALASSTTYKWNYIIIGYN